MADEVQTEADKAEEAEWDAALEEFAPGLSVEQTTDTTTVAPETTDTTTVTETTTVAPDDTTTTTTTEVVDETTTTTTTIDPNETAEQKAEREATATTTTTTVEPEEPDTTVSDIRRAQRETAKFTEEVKADVREKMFADEPKALVDNDGDPINTIDDVMKLNDPRTGEPFTVEAAGSWLLAAQQQFNKQLADTDKLIDQIAEVHVDLKDQADAINYKYGEFLKARPDLRDELWAKYEASLVKDKDSGIITGMPMSLETFYEAALTPYAKLAESMEAQSEQEAKDAAEAKTAADKAEADEKKRKDATDRSDIFGPGQEDLTDDEEKEWNDAAADYYGPLLKK